MKEVSQAFRDYAALPVGRGVTYRLFWTKGSQTVEVTGHLTGPLRGRIADIESDLNTFVAPLLEMDLKNTDNFFFGAEGFLGGAHLTNLTLSPILVVATQGYLGQDEEVEIFQGNLDLATLETKYDTGRDEGYEFSLSAFGLIRQLEAVNVSGIMDISEDPFRGAATNTDDWPLSMLNIDIVSPGTPPGKKTLRYNYHGHVEGEDSLSYDDGWPIAIPPQGQNLVWLSDKQGKHQIAVACPPLSYLPGESCSQDFVIDDALQVGGWYKNEPAAWLAQLILDKAGYSGNIDVPFIPSLTAQNMFSILQRFQAGATIPGTLWDPNYSEPQFAQPIHYVDADGNTIFYTALQTKVYRIIMNSQGVATITSAIPPSALLLSVARGLAICGERLFFTNTSTIFEETVGLFSYALDLTDFQVHGSPLHRIKGMLQARPGTSEVWMAQQDSPTFSVNSVGFAFWDAVTKAWNALDELPDSAILHTNEAPVMFNASGTIAYLLVHRSPGGTYDLFEFDIDGVNWRLVVGLSSPIAWTPRTQGQPYGVTFDRGEQIVFTHQDFESDSGWGRNITAFQIQCVIGGSYVVNPGGTKFSTSQPAPPLPDIPQEAMVGLPLEFFWVRDQQGTVGGATSGHWYGITSKRYVWWDRWHTAVFARGEISEGNNLVMWDESNPADPLKVVQAFPSTHNYLSGAVYVGSYDLAQPVAIKLSGLAYSGESAAGNANMRPLVYGPGRAPQVSEANFDGMSARQGLSGIAAGTLTVFGVRENSIMLTARRTIGIPYDLGPECFESRPIHRVWPSQYDGVRLTIGEQQFEAGTFAFGGKVLDLDLPFGDAEIGNELATSLHALFAQFRGVVTINALLLGFLESLDALRLLFADGTTFTGQVLSLALRSDRRADLELLEVIG